MIELAQSLLNAHSLDAILVGIIAALLAAVSYQTKRIAAAEDARSKDRAAFLKDIQALTATIERMTYVDRIGREKSRDV
jgi:hypothetical protein